MMIYQQFLVDTNQNEWYLLKPFSFMAVLGAHASEFLMFLTHVHLKRGTKKRGA